MIYVRITYQFLNHFKIKNYFINKYLSHKISLNKLKTLFESKLLLKFEFFKVIPKNPEWNQRKRNVP